MEVQILHNKSDILAFLKNSPEFQIYCIGDLDSFFWKKTIWYALIKSGEIKSIALLYVGMDTPTLLTFYEKEKEYASSLLEQIKPFLPNRFYAHLSPGLIKIFGKQSIIEYYGLHYKMALRNDLPSNIADNNIRNLTVDDLPIIQNFYSSSYPNNWFDQRMLETKKYYGYFVNNKLVGISGIHVYSGEYRVAALGNIATHPDYRRQQIAFKLTSKLCNDLIKTVDFIGLNVKADNNYAINCYKKTGFDIIGTYEEYYLKNTSA